MIRSRRAVSGRAFTLVELMVVIVVIGLLTAAALTAGISLLAGAKSRATQGVLQVVDTALEEFRLNPPKIVTRKWGDGGTLTYADRYGKYPPDELEVLTDGGLMAADGGTALSIVKTGWSMVPASPGVYPSMKFVQSTKPDDMAMEHRDLAAMLLTIDLYSETASSILDRISERHRRTPLAANGTPLQFLNRGSNPAWNPEEDVAVKYVLDDWGIPLSYMSQRDYVEDGTQIVAGGSGNSKTWNHASSEMIRLNHGKPIIFSYGPDGREQLTADAMQDAGEASLAEDWSIPNDDHRISNPSNTDNVFINEQLRERLTVGAPE